MLLASSGVVLSTFLLGCVFMLFFGPTRADYSRNPYGASLLQLHPHHMENPYCSCNPYGESLLQL